jgi:ribA/ribD-fused uncharacterized protein
VLSQNDKPTNIIDRFNDSNRFLSNFYPSTIFYEGLRYPSVEHAYQSLKSSIPEEREKIRNAISAGQAKKIGKTVTLREDWEQIKVPLMKDLLRLKFDNPFLRYKLLATGNSILIEGNTWNDVFWGVCRGNGLNMLGKLLMEVREELTQNSPP